MRKTKRQNRTLKTGENDLDHSIQGCHHYSCDWRSSLHRPWRQCQVPLNSTAAPARYRSDECPTRVSRHQVPTGYPQHCLRPPACFGSQGKKQPSHHTPINARPGAAKGSMFARPGAFRFLSLSLRCALVQRSLPRKSKSHAAAPHGRAPAINGGRERDHPPNNGATRHST